jgi:hypothetical protein
MRACAREVGVMLRHTALRAALPCPALPGLPPVHTMQTSTGLLVHR